ncbi:6619_t:CDS:2 [Entrophospora sp. SA101]|nr:6619_t:CDS:2 [Entrophospora sp. SA101]
MWTQKSILMNFDEIECLTIHSYDDAIKERKEERSMNGVQLIGIEERQLHSMQDYLEGLKMITSINKDVDAHDLDSFKEAFQKSKRYPYTMSDLEYLSEKTSLFLLNYFQQIYKNLGLLGGSVKIGEKRKRKSKINQYKLASLELEVDLMCLPIGFSTGSPPKMRLEKGKEELTEEDIENPNAEEGDEEEQDEVELNINNQERMSIEFHNALNNIKEW